MEKKNYILLFLQIAAIAVSGRYNICPDYGADWHYI